MWWTAILKAGAIGIGLAILGYTATLLRQELKRAQPPPSIQKPDTDLHALQSGGVLHSDVHRASGKVCHNHRDRQ